MEIEIRLFATLKDRAGQNQIRISVAEPADVSSLLEAIAGAIPALAPALPTSLVAVNKAYAGPNTAIQPGDEVALFPPVSGGGDSDLPHPTYFAITTEDVDQNALRIRLTRPDVGAIVTFTGAVRGETQRQGLPPTSLYLEY